MPLFFNQDPYIINWDISEKQEKIVKHILQY